MIMKVMKVCVVVLVGIIFAGTAMAQEYAKDFAPVLQKVLINGKVLFEDGKVKNKTVEVDSAKPVKILYIFKNTGTKATTVMGKIFVHFVYNKKIVMGGDFWPKTLTTKWEKDFVFSQTNNVNLKKAKGKTVAMKLGIYFPKAKGSRLKFKGVDGGKRLSVGKIVVK